MKGAFIPAQGLNGQDRHLPLVCAQSQGVTENLCLLQVIQYGKGAAFDGARADTHKRAQLWEIFQRRADRSIRQVLYEHACAAAILKQKVPVVQQLQRAACFDQ
ncbi:hypothetical protein [Ruegeria atlantica]|uniref:hypothetical protein n=1 Tax=Ruegeria atlantica TaxID=81569 RepID=UPI00147C50EE|nr:hypothetical protein [Ruegeria atlantica]